MDRMIRDLLDFARGRLGGGFVVVPTPFDARALIALTVQEMAHAHTDRDVRCVDTATGDFNVEWDSDRIQQVISNLVSNALTHGSDPIVVDLKDEGDKVSINVCNGGEIPADILPRLFDAFASDTPDKRGPSLGLGLYIVQQVALAHGGTVRAASSEGQTTVTVRLPRHASPTVP
jgi:signal transduction histidine kinase